LVAGIHEWCENKTLEAYFESHVHGLARTGMKYPAGRTMGLVNDGNGAVYIPTHDKYRETGVLKPMAGLTFIKDLYASRPGALASSPQVAALQPVVRPVVRPVVQPVVRPAVVPGRHRVRKFREDIFTRFGATGPTPTPLPDMHTSDIEQSADVTVLDQLTEPDDVVDSPPPRQRRRVPSDMLDSTSPAAADHSYVAPPSPQASDVTQGGSKKVWPQPPPGVKCSYYGTAEQAVPKGPRQTGCWVDNGGTKRWPHTNPWVCNPCLLRKQRREKKPSAQ
jgi:hypothetical protein